MEGDNYPALITAIAGILGILINISVSSYFRGQDIHDKRKFQTIKSLESFYLPLNNRLKNINRLLNTLSQVPEKCIIADQLSSYLDGSIAIPGNQRKSFEDLKDAFIDTAAFIQNEHFDYLNDYKVKYFRDRVTQTLLAIQQGISSHASRIIPEYLFTDINTLSSRIEKKAITIYSSNFLHRIYLAIWQRIVDK